MFEKQSDAADDAAGRLQSVFDAMGEGVALYDLVFDEDGRPIDYRFVDVNPAWERATGLQRGAVVGLTGAEVYGDIDPPGFAEYTMVALIGEPYAMEPTVGPDDRVWDVRVYSPGSGRFVVVMRDATEETAAVARQRVALEVLREMNAPGPTDPAVERSLALLHSFLGCQAAAMRIARGNEFPVVHAIGLPVPNGSDPPGAERCVASADQPCLCGDVLAGRCPPEVLALTQRGSFWSDHATSVAGRRDQTPPGSPPCCLRSFRAVAVIPMRSRSVTYGLLCVGDSLSGRLTAETVEFLEGLCENVGAVLARRASEAQACVALERYRALVASVAGGVALHDPEGNVLEANDAAVRLLALPHMAIAGSPLIPHNQRVVDATGFVIGRDLHPVMRAISNEASIHDAIIGLGRADSSGVDRWLLVNVEPVVDDRTGAVSAAAATYTEITDRIRQEEALRQSEARFRAMNDASPLGIYLLDESRSCVYANSRLQGMLGLSFEECQGEGWTAAVHPDDRQLLQGECGAAPRERRESVRLRVLRRSGQHALVELREAPVNDSGQVRGFVGTIEDVTVQSDLEEQFRQVRKMEGIGRLAGGIAHDFNNLLTAMIGYMDLAEADAPTGAVQRYIASTRAAANRGASLTRQLLAFARRQIIEPRPTDLGAMIMGMDPMFRRVIGEEIELLTLASPETWTVRVDPGQIEQLIVNLVVNARDAMPGGGRITIETANVEIDAHYCARHVGAHPGPHVMLAVSDTGYGMSPELRERVFEPFFTTKGQGHGAGLGLAACYGIARQNGGTIWVYSEVGHGTTFKVYLPRADEDRSVGQAPAPLAAASRGSERVLVVEDEPLVRDIACECLRSFGYEVLSAANAAEAEAAAATAGRLDLLLTDVVMPRVSGKQLADRLRRQDPALRVLYMSGYTGGTVLHHGALEPGFAFIQKPFTPEGLAQKVRQVIDGPAV